MTYRYDTSNNFLSLATCLGGLGGVLNIISIGLTSNGFLQIWAYPVMLFISAFMIMLPKKSKTSFYKVFFSALTTFSVITLITYLYIITVVNPKAATSIITDLRLFALLLFIGIIVSFSVSLISKKFVAYIFRYSNY